MTREAELELEIARLKKAYVLLEGFAQSVGGSSSFWEDMDEVLEPASIIANFNPPSTTALQELITEVERRTIERCAKAADELRHTDGFSAESADWCSGTIHSAYAIRALPTGNLKLEDLK